MDRFFGNVSKNTSTKPPPTEPESAEAEPKKALPKGVVLGKDGKPCRSCTDMASWRAMGKNNNSPSSSNSSTPPSSVSSSTTSHLPTDCPPDVALLGRSTWTFLHTLTASYPPTATPPQQREMTQFLHLFSRLYPCWTCAEDFQQWMAKEGNGPRVGGRGELGRWMCEAHNEVNRKLGKEEFECGGWEERWRTGGEGCG